jgi:nucleotide-binding universal stress UspA family protein
MTTDLIRPLVAVGVDGSPESAKATAWAANYARLTGGTLELVIAWARPLSYGLPLVVGGYNPEAEARAIVEKAAADIDLPVERIHLAVENAAAPTALLAHAARADLLVVGSRGHGGFSELLLGSVSMHCVHHSTCPVVVVR